MSNITDYLLSGQAFGAGVNNPMLDPSYGGQEGWAPVYTQWVNNSAYIKRNIVCILLEAPKFFTYMPNPTVWTQVLKSIFETQCRTIEGLNSTLTVETEEHPVGGSGEVQQEATNVKRERSPITMTFIEKYGMPISTFFYNWIAYGIMDPESKYPNLSTLSAASPLNLLPDMYSASALFFEPDPLHQTVISSKAWLITNMFPLTSGEIVGKKDKNSANEMQELSIEFASLAQTGLGVAQTAQQILNNINVTNANPYLRQAFITSISSDVAAATNAGYTQDIQNLAETAIQR